MVSSRGKILPSNGAHLVRTLICFRNMRRSWSVHGSMSSQPQENEAIRAAQQATKTIPIVALLDDMYGARPRAIDGAAGRQYHRHQLPYD